jgi:hypothetical protein
VNVEKKERADRMKNPAGSRFFDAIFGAYQLDP